MSNGDGSQPGGCRSLMAGGCLLGVGALWLAAAAFILMLFLVIWVVQFGWSLLW